MGKVESPKVEVKHFTDGSVEVEILTPYGEPIVCTRVSERSGWNDEFAEHKVMFSQRDDSHLDARCMIGSEFLVKVPLSNIEQREARRRAPAD